MTSRLSPQARKDLDEIWDYLVSESGSDLIADRWIDSIVARFNLLAPHPLIGRTRTDLGEGRRSFPVGNYVIIYRLADADVLILRVIHGRRDLSRLLDV